MGPLFSAILMTIASGILLSVMFFLFRLFMTTPVALRCAIGFVIGAGLGAPLAVGLLAIVIGVGTTLQTKLQVAAYFSTVAIGATLGGTTLS